MNVRAPYRILRKYNIKIGICIAAISVESPLGLWSFA
jgi:hypothetical protein